MQFGLLDEIICKIELRLAQMFAKIALGEWECL